MDDLRYDIAPLARVLTGALLVFVVATLAVAAHSGVLVWYFGQLAAVNADIFQLSMVADRIQTWGFAIGAGYLVVFAICVVASCVWIYRAATNAAQLCPEKKTMSPTQSVVWFFVPLANLIKPFHGMREIWNATFAPFQPIDTDVPRFIKLWWGCCVVYGLMVVAVLALRRGTDTDIHTAAEIINISTTPFAIIGAVLFAMIVRQVSRQQPFAARSLSHNKETSNDEV